MSVVDINLTSVYRNLPQRLLLRISGENKILLPVALLIIFINMYITRKLKILRTVLKLFSKAQLSNSNSFTHKYVYVCVIEIGYLFIVAFSVTFY